MSAAYQRAWRRARREKGICVRCRLPALPGKAECNEHASRGRVQWRARHAPDRVPTFAEFEREVGR